MSAGAWPVVQALDMAAQNWEFFLAFYVSNFVAAATVMTSNQLHPERRREAMALIRQSVSQADWLVMARAWSTSSIEDVLPRLVTPTLLLHPREYINIGIEETTGSQAWYHAAGSL